MDSKEKRRAERVDAFFRFVGAIVFGIAKIMEVVLVALFGLICGASVGTIDFDRK